MYVIIPLLVILISLIWIFGIMSLLNIPVDLMLTIMPTLVFVLGTSVAIHFLSKFRKHFLMPADKISAIKQAFLQTTIPNSLITVTTAVGLGSLCFIPVDSIQKFGLLSAMAVLISLFLGIILTPHLLTRFSISPELKTTKVVWLPDLSLHIESIVFGKSRKYVLIGYLLLSVVAVGGIFKIQINNNFLDDLDDKSVLKKDLRFFENEFAGIRPFEIAIENKKQTTSILDYQNIRTIDSIEQYVKTKYQLGMVQSPVFAVKMLNKALHAGNQDFFRLLDDQREYNTLMRKARKFHLFERIENLITSNQQTARISGRLADSGSKFYAGKNKEFNYFIDSLDESIQVNLTGLAYLIDNANVNITRNFMLGLMLVMTVVTFMISSYTASLRLSMLALLVNIIPLLITGAIRGYMGIQLKISTVLIFTIVLGIAVDDTIHFLHHYISMVEKHSRTDALKLSIRALFHPIFVLNRLNSWTGFVA